jgi:hypothetical protein
LPRGAQHGTRALKVRTGNQYRVSIAMTLRMSAMGQEKLVGRHRQQCWQLAVD